jgi:hypothetical protein
MYNDLIVYLAMIYRYMFRLALRLSKWIYDTFIGAATGAARCDYFVVNGFGLLVDSSKCTRRFTWFGPREHNTLCPYKNEVVLLKPGIARVSLSIFFFFDPLDWRLPGPFIVQGRTVTMSPKARQVALGQVGPYAIGHQRLGVANDFFNDMDTPGLVACHATLGQQCDTVLSESLDTVAALEEWFIVLTLHCSRTVATCLSVLPA